MAAPFYKLNTLIRLFTDQLLGYRLCHLSKSWDAGKKQFFFVLVVVKSYQDNSMVNTRRKGGEGRYGGMEVGEDHGEGVNGDGRGLDLGG